MTDDSLDDVCKAKLKGVDIGKMIESTQSVYGREIWNAAIEAAANVSEINSAANIRKLKK